MSAYFGPWRLVCPQPVTPAIMALARKLVGGMLDVGGIPTRTWKLDDGTVITALIVNGLPNVHVSLPPPVTELPVPFTSLWIPRGFVVYPAWADAPMGVGLPIVQQGSDPYASTNLSPGLTTTRWTAGGPCGEVLLSPDDQAGYPLETVFPAPLLADATAGPQFRWTGPVNVDARVPSSTWAGYRLELAPFRAHFSGENIATQQALFEAVNNVRHTAGQTQALLRFRGFARVAEMAASIFDAAGKDDETSTTYPVTFQSSADRLTKEGYAIDWTDANLSSFTRADMFAMYEFRASGLTPTAAVQAWQQQSGSMLTANLGSSVQADVGYRNGFSVLALTARDRWLEAGNANWQSTDTTLPPISWHSFASMNLAWETYPAIFDATNGPTPVYAFTGSTGDCWLNYPRSTTVEPALYEPALSRHIYCRGRSIALAPRGGLVWAAAIAPNGKNDRLLALVHHPEDQPSTPTTDGYVRYLRVWWVDIPVRDGLRISPQQVICGEAAGDSCAWRGGDLVDLGMMPAPSAGFVAGAGTNSLKYASVWRFSPDGLHACCLRDYGARADYMFLAQAVNNGWSAALHPRCVELTFTLVSDAVTVNTTFHDYTAGGIAPARAIASKTPPDTQDVYDIEIDEIGALPIAVDYVSSGQLMYAYSAQVASKQSVFYSPTDGSAGFDALVTYSYVGTGDASVQYASDLSRRVLHGGRFKTSSQQAYFELAIVLDVVDAAFAMKVSAPRFIIDPSHTSAGLMVDGGVPCPTFTTNLVDGVLLCHQGALVHEEWYASPDGAVFTTNDMCYPTSSDVSETHVYLPLAVSAFVQGFYAKRYGEHVMAYQCSPMPHAVVQLSTAPSASPCGCWKTPGDVFNAPWMTSAQLSPRGGKAMGSVQLPSNDWLIFAKVV